MNKAELRKSIGMKVQLRPPAVARDGHALDRDWIIRDVDAERIQIDMVGGGYTVPLGLDHVYSFVTNPNRRDGDTRFGFLQLHVQLIVMGNSVQIEPLPPPKAQHLGIARNTLFAPLSVEDTGRSRFFSWSSRDPLHLIEREEAARPVGTFVTALTDALRRVDGMHPRFVRGDKIRGEVVYELAPDFRTKWQLRGGHPSGNGEQVLVMLADAGVRGV